MSRHHRRAFPVPHALLAAALLAPVVPALADPAQAEPMDFEALYREAVVFHESVGAAKERLKEAAYERDKVFAMSSHSSCRPSLIAIAGASMLSEKFRMASRTGAGNTKE